jgi:hypothetical protein
MEYNLNAIQKSHLWVSRIILSIGLVPFIFMNTPMMLILLIGLYLKGAYRYIWKVPGNEKKEGTRSRPSAGNPHDQLHY